MRNISTNIHIAAKYAYSIYICLDVMLFKTTDNTIAQVFTKSCTQPEAGG